eukprot:CAMPEP_0119083982 /NCGR_PEP_ID=MMETSP1178-20130426/127742_1 /TAXON_ID=33656 /ORGANISM="unid sp, Strain CCMP2000" /LENGTH=38 /DNA_ID= /DNA_START= /DNA_END= /DNA_ORIENTATION=
MSSQSSLKQESSRRLSSTKKAAVNTSGHVWIAREAVGK